METEKISIIVPIYNVEEYLKKCVESLTNQTYSNLEILLIDDGSNDESSSICDEFEKKDKRIKVIHKENAGVSSARNLGIKTATGEWITFIDPDDWAENNMIERAISIANQYEADIVQWNSYYNKQNEQTKRKAINPSIIERKEQEIKLLQLDILSTIYEEKQSGISVGPIRGVWGKLYKAEILKNIEFDTNLFAFEDGLFNLYVFERCSKIVLFNEYLHHYRINKASVCNSYKPTWIEQNEQILNKVNEFIKEKQKDKEFSLLYNALACELFTSCLTRCIFHKDNKNTKEEKKMQLRNYTNTEKYKNVLNNIDFRYLNGKQKLIIYLAKTEKIDLIYFVYELKQLIKK